MSAFTIETVTKDSACQNDDLRLEMIRVLQHAYIHPEKVIDKRFYSLNKLFLLRQDGVLRGFCTYTLIDLEVEDQILPTVYLGIMAASPGLQNTGIVLKTMDAMVEDIRSLSSGTAGSILVWATTASPSSLFIFRHYFREVSPDENGKIRNGHRAYEKVMRKILLQDTSDTDSPPLVIRNAAPLSAYSTLERNRIKALKQRKKDNIFDIYDIDDVRGDRLILIGRV